MIFLSWKISESVFWWFSNMYFIFPIDVIVFALNFIKLITTKNSSRIWLLENSCFIPCLSVTARIFPDFENKYWINIAWNKNYYTNNPIIMKKLLVLIESDAKNYFESSERLFLMNLLKKLEDGQKLSENDHIKFNNISKAYDKLLN